LEIVGFLKVKNGTLRMDQVLPNILFYIPLFFLIEFVDDLLDLRKVADRQSISILVRLSFWRSLISLRHHWQCIITGEEWRESNLCVFIQFERAI
jgi:hypothetical protein